MSDKWDRIRQNAQIVADANNEGSPWARVALELLDERDRLTGETGMAKATLDLQKRYLERQQRAIQVLMQLAIRVEHAEFHNTLLELNDWGMNARLEAERLLKGSEAKGGAAKGEEES